MFVCRWHSVVLKRLSFKLLKGVAVSSQREQKLVRSSVSRCISYCSFGREHHNKHHCLPGTAGLFRLHPFLAGWVVRLSSAQLLGEGFWLQTQPAILTMQTVFLTFLAWLSFFLSHQLICSYVFMPLSFMMGVSWDDSFLVAELIGLKTFLNEFVAYQRLSEFIKRREAGGPEYVNNIKQYISVSLIYIFIVYHGKCRLFLTVRLSLNIQGWLLLYSFIFFCSVLQSKFNSIALDNEEIMNIMLPRFSYLVIKQFILHISIKTWSYVKWPVFFLNV